MSILPSPWIGSWSYSSFFILLFSNLSNKSIGLMFPVSIGLPCIENLMLHLALLLTSCLVAPSNVTFFERIWESIPLKRILLCLSLESIETICLLIYLFKQKITQALLYQYILKSLIWMKEQKIDYWLHDIAHI